MGDSLTEEQIQRAESVGLKTDKVLELLHRVQREVEEGLLPSAQVAIARDGKVGVFESYGSARSDSLTCIFSATKAITSSAAWILIQEGKLSEDEIVADIVPEFGTNEKDQITVEQLFTHTAGFPSAPFAPLEWVNKEKRYGRFAKWRLNWEPGSRYEYHPSSSMWVIGDIIERRGEQSYTEFVKEKVLDPLGLTNLIVGMSEEQSRRALDVAHSGDPLTSEDYAKMGIPEPPITEVTEEALLNFNRAEIQAVGVPGGGGYANAHDLALFYQALLHGGLGDVQIWSDETLGLARKVRSGELRDPLFLSLIHISEPTRPY